MEKLSVFEKSDDFKGEVKKISETEMKQIADVFSWRTNQILCNWWWANIFSIMRKLDQPRRNK